MATSKDNLLVQKEADGALIDASLVSLSFPADAVGPAHKKHAYHLSDGTRISYGWTKAEAIQVLLAVANECNWVVLHRSN